MNETGEASPYSPEFYDWQEEGALRSAREIVPQVLGLVRPESVLDVGCGTGVWLSVFQENGVQDIQGVDGEYIERDRLKIPQEKFKEHDLENGFDLEKQFDLVSCLEVAEHISEGNARNFIDSLTRHAPAILFSAAIPHQGGVSHVNEQWPSYWASLFREKGYVPLDVVRRKVWDNENVEWWYAQNVLLFVKTDSLVNNPSLLQALALTNASQLDLVHPKNYEAAVSVSPEEDYRQKRYS